MGIRSCWPFRPEGRRFPVLAALFAAAALSACAAPDTLSSSEPLPADPVERLYARGLDQIANYYIEPISTRVMALSGARRLAQFDQKLSISETPGADARYVLALSYGGQTVTTWPLPYSNSANDWAALLNRVIAAAKGASPRLAAVPQDKIDKAVFDGATSVLDRYSRYSPPDVARDQRAARDGFGGIGVQLEGREAFRVTGVSPDSPAERAGIRIDDTIVAINGTQTAGHDQADIVHQLRGPIGTAVELQVAHAGAPHPKSYRLQRAFVTLPTVNTTRDGNIAIFRIASFNQSTTQRLAEELRKASNEAGGRLGGIVLDLRGNPGGLLEQAVSLAELFIPEGPIVATVGRNPRAKQYFAAKGDSVTPRTPVVVLMNGGSASASEIVAAAIQDVGRGVVIGSSSYGKGTVQTVLPLPNDGDLILTWARLVSPAGYLLQAHGVVPTVCTSDLGDDPGAIDAAIQRMGSGAGPAGRAALDDAGWAQLRQSCPSRPGSRPLDIKVAERMLADPALYAAALHGQGPTAHLAGGSVVAASEASLTGLDGALHSPPSTP